MRDPIGRFERERPRPMLPTRLDYIRCAESEPPGEPEVDYCVVAREEPLRNMIRLVGTRDVAETQLSQPIRQARDERYAKHIEGFDAALRTKALDHLDSVSRDSEVIESTFDGPSSPAWDQLRSAIGVERVLIDRERALECDFRGLVSSIPPGGFVSGPASERTREQMSAVQDAIAEVRRARVALHVANPALAFVDAEKIDLSRTNEALAPKLHDGAKDLRGKIADVRERIESRDIELRSLDRLVALVLKEQQISEDRAASSDEKSHAVLDDLAMDSENKALAGAGAFALSALLTAASFGTGSLAVGVVGTAFGFGTAAIDFEEADDFDDVGRASMSDADALIEAQTARERYAMALAGVVLAGVDTLLAGKALRVSLLVKRFKHGSVDFISKTGFRNTLGRSGTPTATPPLHEPHLAAIHRGMEMMPADIRRQLDDMLQGGEAGRKIRKEMSAVVDEGHALAAERASLAKRGVGDTPERKALDQREAQNELQYAKLETSLNALEKNGRQMAAKVLKRFLQTIQRDVEAAELAAQVQIDRSALKKIAPQLQNARADFRGLSGEALLARTEREIRIWLEDYFRIADPRIAPKDLRLSYAPPVGDIARPHYIHGKGINVGEEFAKKDLFHEATHAIEYVDSEVSRTTKSWRDTRARGVDPSMPVDELSTISENGKFKKGERGYAQHDFSMDYVGKLYPDGEPGTEVLSVFAEQLENGISAAKLYATDPEMFFLGLGLLRR